MDVGCTECHAAPFAPCTYVDTPANQKRGLVGKPITRSTKDGPIYWYHNWRKWDQEDFSSTYSCWYADKHAQMRHWLFLYADILTGTRADINPDYTDTLYPKRKYPGQCYHDLEANNEL